MSLPMDLKTFISDTARRRALAEAVGTSPVYLWQVGTGWKGRKPSPELALAIERESDRIGPAQVPRESMRPDIWSPSDAGDPASHQVVAAAEGSSAAATDGDPAQPIGRAA
jgi:DNA-binding transcriptional regulator YdaS (Cro superfamily)